VVQFLRSFSVLSEAEEDWKLAVVDRERARVQRAGLRGRGKRLRHRNHEQENDDAMTSLKRSVSKIAFNGHSIKSQIFGSTHFL